MRRLSTLAVAVALLAAGCSSSKPSQSSINAAAAGMAAFDTANGHAVADAGFYQSTMKQLADKCSNSPTDVAAKAEQVATELTGRGQAESAATLTAGMATGLVYAKRIDCVEVLDIYSWMRPAVKA